MTSKDLQGERSPLRDLGFDANNTRDPLDGYSISFFLDNNWPEQLENWGNGLNSHARFADLMETSSDEEAKQSKTVQNSNIVRQGPRLAQKPLLRYIPDLMVNRAIECRQIGVVGQAG